MYRRINSAHRITSIGSIQRFKNSLRDITKVDFDDAKKCFKMKSFSDLIKSYVVFSFCQSPLVVRNSEILVQLCYKILGKTVTNAFLKLTFYGHFCAGEDTQRIKPTIDYLHMNGVGSILDYASEADVVDQKPAILSAKTKENIQCRVYDYRDEELCDDHRETFVKCIRAVHAVSPTGFAAIKATALGNPKLLESMSIAIVELRKLFLKFDTEGTGLLTKKQFRSAYSTYFEGGDVEAVFRRLDTDNDQRIDYIEWSNGLALQDLHNLTAHCRQTGPLAKAVLDENERKLMTKMSQRIHSLAELASELGVRLMIDAEHTYFQPAIDYITAELARKYNKSYPVIFSTYQMYLKDSHRRLITDIDRARIGNYKFAAKLVRGAYMVLERRRALELAIEDPIHNTLIDTHNNYNRAVEEVVGRIARGEDLEIMIASHNQESVELTLAAMQRHGLGPSTGIYFGQLLGMSDNLSFTLGSGGYKAYKYVPYGKVEEVMPYLIRRAQENSDALGAAAKEIKMVKAELRRRVFGA